MVVMAVIRIGRTPRDSGDDEGSRFTVTLSPQLRSVVDQDDTVVDDDTDQDNDTDQYIGIHQRIAGKQ